MPAENLGMTAEVVRPVRVQHHGQGLASAYFPSFSSTHKRSEFKPKCSSSQEAAVGLTSRSTTPARELSVVKTTLGAEPPLRTGQVLNEYDDGSPVSTGCVIRVLFLGVLGA